MSGMISPRTKKTKKSKNPIKTTGKIQNQKINPNLAKQNDDTTKKNLSFSQQQNDAFNDENLNSVIEKNKTLIKSQQSSPTINSIKSSNNSNLEKMRSKIRPHLSTKTLSKVSPVKRPNAKRKSISVNDFPEKTKTPQQLHFKNPQSKTLPSKKNISFNLILSSDSESISENKNPTPIPSNFQKKRTKTSTRPAKKFDNEKPKDNDSKILSTNKKDIQESPIPQSKTPPKKLTLFSDKHRATFSPYEMNSMIPRINSEAQKQQSQALPINISTNQHDMPQKNILFNLQNILIETDDESDIEALEDSDTPPPSPNHYNFEVSCFSSDDSTSSIKEQYIEKEQENVEYVSEEEQNEESNNESVSTFSDKCTVDNQSTAETSEKVAIQLPTISHSSNSSIPEASNPSFPVIDNASLSMNSNVKEQNHVTFNLDDDSSSLKNHKNNNHSQSKKAKSQMEDILPDPTNSYSPKAQIKNSLSSFSELKNLFRNQHHHVKHPKSESKDTSWSIRFLEEIPIYELHDKKMQTVVLASDYMIRQGYYVINFPNYLITIQVYDSLPFLNLSHVPSRIYEFRNIYFSLNQDQIDNSFPKGFEPENLFQPVFLPFTGTIQNAISKLSRKEVQNLDEDYKDGVILHYVKGFIPEECKITKEMFISFIYKSYQIINGRLLITPSTFTIVRPKGSVEIEISTVKSVVPSKMSVKIQYQDKKKNKKETLEFQKQNDLSSFVNNFNSLKTGVSDELLDLVISILCQNHPAGNLTEAMISAVTSPTLLLPIFILKTQNITLDTFKEKSPIICSFVHIFQHCGYLDFLIRTFLLQEMLETQRQVFGLTEIKPIDYTNPSTEQKRNWTSLFEHRQNYLQQIFIAFESGWCYRFTAEIEARKIETTDDFLNFFDISLNYIGEVGLKIFRQIILTSIFMKKIHPFYPVFKFLQTVIITNFDISSITNQFLNTSSTLANSEPVLRLAQLMDKLIYDIEEPAVIDINEDTKQTYQFIQNKKFEIINEFHKYMERDNDIDHHPILATLFWCAKFTHRSFY